MKRIASCLLVLCLLAPTAYADELLMDAVQQANASNVNRPRSGVTMDAVRSRFGDPQHVIPAVGDPPITRWQYADFTVYFEKDRVIHTVMNR
ncbi:MAG: hypothetical protein PVH31_07360 [Ectothiorhodospiraceae bacterium]|jgi:hypothetical protein